MAKKTQVRLDVKADDKGTLKKVGLSAKKAGNEMEHLSNASNNARRNMGGAANMSNRGTKNFSKMQQGVGGLVGVYADLAARVFAVSAAFQFLKSASDVVNLIAGQEALGAVTGVAYKTITASIKEATGGQIAYADAARAAAIGTAAGLSPDQLNRLGAAAKNVSNALGRDLTDSFNRLVRGITKAEPELLDELGIILRLDDAAEKYADRMGLVKDDLTTFQKSQAVANETLEQAEKKFGQIAEIMDPSATSLNRFLVSFDDLMNSIKKGSMTLLRPVFDFLAGNTAALTAALAAVTIPIIKTIIPNFGEMAKRMDKSIKNQSKSIDKYKVKINETKDAIAAMTADKAGIGASTAGVFSKLGVSTTGKEGGRAGADFLLGTSDSKSAQNNAKKILDNAKAQLKDHHIVTKGYLVGATEKELKILQKNYAKRKLLLKDFELAHKNSWARMAGYAKMGGQYIVSGFMSVGKAMTGVASFISGAVSKILGLAMWASIIGVAIQAVGAWMDAVNPISKTSKDNAAAIKKFEKEAATLNEELSKTADAQPFRTLTQQVIQVGNAVNSTDILVKLKELKRLQNEPPPEKTWLQQMGHDILMWMNPKYLNNMAKASDTFEKMKQQGQAGGWFKKSILGVSAWISTAIGKPLKAMREETAQPHWKKMADETEGFLKNLTRLDDEFRPFLEEFQKFGELSDESTQNLNKLISKFKEWAVEIQATKDKIKEMDDELKGMIGTGLIEDPTVMVRSKAQAVIDSTTKSIQALRDRNTKAGDFSDKNQILFAEGALRMKELFPKGNKNLNAEQLLQFKELQGYQEKYKSLWEAAVETIKNGVTEIEEMEKAQTRAKIILTQMQIVSKNVTGIFRKRNELEIKAAKRQTLGITIEQKRENLYAKQLGQRAKRLSLIAKQEQARGTLVAAAEVHEEERSKKSGLNLKNAKNAHELAKKDVEVFDILNVLFKQRLDYQREELDIMERKLSRANNLRLLEKKAHRDELKRRRSETLSAGTVGGLIGRAPEEISSLKNLNKRQRILDQIAIQERRRGDAQDARDDEEKRDNARASELFNLTNIADQAERKVDALKEELFLLDKINQISTQKLLDDQEDVRGRIGGLSISKRATFVNEQMRTLDPEATDEERAAHKAAAEELYNLNLQLENTQSLYDTIDTSMQSAFEGMITGAMSAKEAFATMAQSILKELARIIAQQMILKALQSATNMGLPIPGMRDGGITPKLTGSRYTVGGIARGPSSGYPAILHGNEAVVPLPSGGAIPVQGNIGGGTNNVTVNVTVDSDGNARNDASGEGQGQDLGKVVARAVQEELQYQKRSGGILNPYGAA